MNESDHEPPDHVNHTDNHTIKTAPDDHPNPLGRRRLWVVIVLFIINSGLPFVYCGNLILGIKVAIFASIVFTVLPVIAILIPTTACLISLAITIALIDLIIFIFAIRYAVNKNKINHHDFFNPWPQIVIFVIIVLVAKSILSGAIKISVIEAFKIPASSMEKTLLVGDYLLAEKISYGARLPIPFTDIRLPASQEPKVNDIIIFKFPLNPGINYIKRCVAVEGQSVEIIDKQLFVDDSLIPLPLYATHSDINLYPHSEAITYQQGQNCRDQVTLGNRDNMPKIVIPKGKLFVMGDNRDNSYDSRFWGCLDRKAVVGKAVMIHWSWTPFDPCDSTITFPRPPETSLSRPWTIFRCLAFNACHFYERIRWSRIGMKIS
jgi:signal peptidase I